MVRASGVFNMLLTSKCAARQDDVHFLNIPTSKSAPNLWCLCRFDFQINGVQVFIPESVWVQGSSNSGGLSLIFSSSHLLIFTSSHLHIFSSSHLLIFTSSHLHIFSSSHLHIFTSSCPWAAPGILAKARRLQLADASFREKKEKARGQEEKMWRCEDVTKMWGCEDEKMWRRGQEAKRRRWEGEKMWTSSSSSPSSSSSSSSSSLFNPITFYHYWQLLALSRKLASAR